MQINIKNIEKTYSIKPVLDKINFTIESNSNYCLIGKNGAGKTTLINIMADFIESDSGEVLFDNLNYETNEIEIKQKIGLLSEENSLIEELSGIEYLTFVGKLYTLSRGEIITRINSLSRYFFDNPADIKKSISIFSTGMKKKLMFCAAVIHKPNFLLLDEPFAGLDPVASNLLVEFLNNYKNKNRIIFLSSHNLNYIEKVATHIGVLDDGGLIFDGTLDSFIAGGKEKIDDSLLNKLNSTLTKIDEVGWAF